MRNSELASTIPDLYKIGLYPFQTDNFDKSKNLQGLIWEGADSLVLKRGNKAIHIYKPHISLEQINLLNEAILFARAKLKSCTVSLAGGKKLAVEIAPIEEVHKHPNGRILTVSPFIEGKDVSRIKNSRHSGSINDTLTSITARLSHGPFDGIDIVPMNVIAHIPLFPGVGKLYIVDLCNSLSKLKQVNRNYTSIQG